jgi:hypothetical protein
MKSKTWALLAALLAVDLLRGDGSAYEVEVVDDAGRTVFLGPLRAEDLSGARG